MRFLCLFSGILMLAFSAAAGDIISINPAERKAVIVIPPKANHGLRYAAQELSYHVEKATGYKIPVSNKSEVPAGSFVISLGETDFARKHGVSGTGMKHNHAQVVADNNKLIITGNDRGNNLAALLVETSGTLVAVYNILENYNGVRWLFPGTPGEVIPKSATFNFKGGKWISNTKLRFFFWRQLWAYQKNWNSKADASSYMHNETIWLVRHRSNRDLSEQHYPHGFEKWPAKYLKTHPEYFNLLPDGTRRSDPTYWGGQAHLTSMCTSDPGFRKQIVQDWLTNFNPAIPRINLKGNDTANKCVCARCLAEDESSIPAAKRLAEAKQRFARGERNWNKALGNGTPRMIKLFKAVQEEVDRVAPEKKAKFSGLIYSNISEPPKAGTFLGDRFQLCFCPPYMFPFPKEKVENYKRMWSGWAATGCDLVIRPNFTLDGHCYPINFAREFYDIFTHAEKNSLTGSDYDSLTGMFGVNGLTLYTIARLQNSKPGSLSFEDIENEYCSAFGNAAKDIKRYFDKTAEISRNAGEQALAAGEEGGNWTGYYQVGYKLFTPAVFAELNAILNDAEKNAAGDETALARVKHIRIGVEHARLTALAAAAFEKYKASGDYVDFAGAIKALDAFHDEYSSSFAFNAGYCNVRENDQWPRAAMAKLNDNTKPLPMEWKFAADPENTGVARGFAKADFDDSAWKMIRTDRPWEEQGFKDLNGSGWYRLTVDIPADCQDRAAVIIGAADEAAEVYINGKKLLDRPYPYQGNINSYAESFEVPWDPVPGKNVIVVRVIDNNGVGGITKPCYLKFEKRIDRKANKVKDSTFTSAKSAWKFHQHNGRSQFGKVNISGENATFIKAVAKTNNKKFYNRYSIWSMLYQNVSGLTPGQEYEVIATYRTSDNFDGRMHIVCHADTQTSRQSDANIQVDGIGKKLRWETLSKKFTARKNNAMIYLNFAANKGSIYFSEVLIVPVKSSKAAAVSTPVANHDFAAKGQCWAFHRRIGQSKVDYTKLGSSNAVTFTAIKGDPAKRFIKKYSVYSLLHQSVKGLEPGKKYKLTITYKTGNGFDGIVLFYAHASSKGGKNAGNIEINGKASDSWTSVSGTFTPDRDSASIYLNFAANKGQLSISEVLITEEK
ncbi:MAG: DUF4838 domain-containing protein [Lentisphaerae bacterium]|nr:DUF4838 domain-containing protein [Lentisphaerota bacterium]